MYYLKTIRSVFAVSVLFFMLILPGSLHAKTYTLGLVEWMPWATAYVAAEKGFWAEEGIDVKIIQYENYATGNLENFKFGEIDFSVLMLGNVVEFATKAPLYKIIYEHDWSHGGDIFILGKKVKTVKQLKGRTIGVYSKTTPINYFIEQILLQNGLKISDVSLRQITIAKNLNRALENNVVSAIVSYDADASIGKIVNSSADFPGVIPEGIAVQRHILEENKDDVRRFLRGWIRAVKWQNDPVNQKEYFAILNRTMFKNSHHSDHEFLELAKGAKIHTSLETIISRNSDHINRYVEKIYNFLEKQNSSVLATDIAVEESKKIF